MYLLLCIIDALFVQLFVFFTVLVLMLCYRSVCVCVCWNETAYCECQIFVMGPSDLSGLTTAARSNHTRSIPCSNYIISAQPKRTFTLKRPR